MRVLVVGLGKSGLAACRLLRRRGDEVLATDSNPEQETLAVLETLGVGFVSDFPLLDLTVISPGVPADLPALQGHNVIGELELAFPYLKGPIAGITGSNGKTTTTALTGHIFKSAGVACQVGGNIGIAPAAMCETSRDGQWNILELSSFQLETTRQFRPSIGVCLNVTPNHLDRHHTLENYAAAKGRMFVNQTPSDAKILNARDAICRGYSTSGAAEVYWFNHGPLNYRTMLRGQHNQENIDAAVAIAERAGIPRTVAVEAAATFPGVEHRLEFVRELSGVAYYNDSKATSVDATLKALAALDGPVWLILGGKDKGSDYRPIAEAMQGRSRGILLIGAAAGKIREQIGPRLELEDCETLERAVALAHRSAQRGDTVLLAPACASFDQFRSFEHRGEVFKSAVAALGKEVSWHSA